MIVAHASDTTLIVGIVALWFVLMAVITLGRSMFTSRHPPKARRFRVGVFVERDHEEPDETELEQEKGSAPRKTDP